MTGPSEQPIRVLVRPVRRRFTRRTQWVFEIRGANGELIDPRDTYNNYVDLLDTMMAVFGDRPVELVTYDRFGNVDDRSWLR